VHSKLYLTGGIGAAGGHEGFGDPYDLPNMSAYNETCASVGMDYWNHRSSCSTATPSTSTSWSAPSTTG
jgi:DUF1680 family protein